MRRVVFMIGAGEFSGPIFFPPVKRIDLIFVVIRFLTFPFHLSR